MIMPTNYYKYIEMLKTKSYEELVNERDALINDIYELEAEIQSGIIASTSDTLYAEFNKKLSLVIDELNIKYDKIQSGFSDEELNKDEKEATVCPRCKFPSKKLRYCPRCNFLKLLSTYDGPDMYDFENSINAAGTHSTYDDNKTNAEDQLFTDAVLFSIESGKISLSMLQRKLRIGYSRAARLLDIMEAKGYIEPKNETKFRKVLITKEEFLNNRS